MKRDAVCRTILIALVVLAGLLLPTTARAQSEIIDWLANLSGPGPFANKGRGYDVNVLCYPLKSDCWSNDGIDLQDDTKPEEQRHRNNAKVVVRVGYSYAWTGSQQLFQDDTTDVRNVKENIISTAVMYRANPIVDVGAGIDFIRFSSDEGAAFSFWRTGWVPARVSVTPLGLIDAKTGRARFTRRLFHLNLEAIWLHEGFSGADFNNAKTKFSVGNEYQTRLSLLIDGVAVARLISGK
jgi:hypothetical protein